MSITLLDCALEYARRGLHVFPCDPFNKTPLVGKDVDANGNKIPKTGGLYKATRDPEQINAWWTKWPNAMIGVRTGEASGIWVLDLDYDADDASKANGLVSWARLKAKHGRCLHTHTNVTPRGGKHLLFRWRADTPLGNSVGQLKSLGIDVRGEGGYVIFPPSQRSDGRGYEVEEPLDYFNVAEAPDWLYELIKPKPALSISQQALAAIPARALTIKSASRKIEGILGAVATANAGDRNKLLFWGACRLAELVQQSFLTPADAFALAVEAGRHAGLPQTEASRTVTSALRGNYV